MSDQRPRTIADLSMHHWLLLTTKLCEAQGYLTPDGLITPSGETYLAALVEEEVSARQAMDDPPEWFYPGVAGEGRSHADDFDF